MYLIFGGHVGRYMTMQGENCTQTICVLRLGRP